MQQGLAKVERRFLLEEKEARILRAPCLLQILLSLRQPLTERSHVVLVVLERVAREDLPGYPIFWHLLEAMRVVQVCVELSQDPLP